MRIVKDTLAAIFNMLIMARERCKAQNSTTSKTLIYSCFSGFETGTIEDKIEKCHSILQSVAKPARQFGHAMQI